MIKSRRTLVIVAVAVAAALAAAAAVKASIPDGAGTIHGCYSKSAPPGGQPGSLRVIDTALGQTCTLSEGAVNWSQTGPPGPQGPQGPQGDRGPTGPKGDPGANAYFAGTGLTLSGGNTFSLSGSYQLPQGCSANQSPFLQNVFPSHPWGCFTAANAGETCSSGKFQNGVDSSGDIKCATPPGGSSLPDVWVDDIGTVNTPQGQTTTIGSLSLPAGSFLLDITGEAADDVGGSDEYGMRCDTSTGQHMTDFGGHADDNVAAGAIAIHDVITLGAATTVSWTCFDYDGTDHVTDAVMTAQAVGTVH